MILPCQGETEGIPELDTKGDVYKTEGENDPLIYDSAVGKKKMIILYVEFKGQDISEKTQDTAEKILAGGKFEELCGLCHGTPIHIPCAG